MSINETPCFYYTFYCVKLDLTLLEIEKQGRNEFVAGSEQDSTVY